MVAALRSSFAHADSARVMIENETMYVRTIVEGLGIARLPNDEETSKLHWTVTSLSRWVKTPRAFMPVIDDELVSGNALHECELLDEGANWQRGAAE
jgi:hypothetical protein